MILNTLALLVLLAIVQVENKDRLKIARYSIDLLIPPAIATIFELWIRGPTVKTSNNFSWRLKFLPVLLLTASPIETPLQLSSPSL